MKEKVIRCKFIGTLSVASLGVAVTGFAPVFGFSSESVDKLAIPKGNLVRKNRPWIDWLLVTGKTVTSIKKSPIQFVVPVFNARNSLKLSMPMKN